MNVRSSSPGRAGSVDNSIQAIARLGGVLLLISIVAGGFGELLAPSQVIVANDAAATAHHIVGSLFFRAGFASYLVEAACDVALAAVLYLLLRPVNAAIALFGVFFHLLATATFAAAELFYFAPALILNGDTYLKTFSTDQLNALALLSLNVYSAGGSLFQIHYGLAGILFGFLMFRSGYLPRLLGLLMALAGVGFLLWNFTFVLIPTFPYAIFGLPTFLSTLLLGIWLVTKGVDREKWESRVKSLEGRPA